MPKNDKKNSSLVDLDDNIVRDAIQKTLGRQYTDEEIENMALDLASESPEFLELERIYEQGLGSYPFADHEVFVPVDEEGDEIIPSDIEVLKYLSSQFVRRVIVVFDLG